MTDPIDNFKFNDPDATKNFDNYGDGSIASFTSDSDFVETMRRWIAATNNSALAAAMRRATPSQRLAIFEDHECARTKGTHIHHVL
jgi:hypothetical protein